MFQSVIEGNSAPPHSTYDQKLNCFIWKVFIPPERSSCNFIGAHCYKPRILTSFTKIISGSFAEQSYNNRNAIISEKPFC